MRPVSFTSLLLLVLAVLLATGPSVQQESTLGAQNSGAQSSLTSSAADSSVTGGDAVVTTTPDVDYDDDEDHDDDEDDDDHDNDAGRIPPQDPSPATSTESRVTANKATTTKPPTLKVCVGLTPAFASTRNGPFVSYECTARLCSEVNDDEDDDDDDDDDDGSDQFANAEQYQFRRPLFDWNSQFTHLLLANGTCDAATRNCWHKIDVNVESLTDAMEADGVEQIEIRCTVADYLRTYDSMNYVFGEAKSVLKFFRGNRAHEPCNSTADCGDNMVCDTVDDNNIQNGQQEWALTADNSRGYCECPAQRAVDSETDSDSGLSLRAFTLATDPQYLEQVCVPLLTVNQTCVYDQQCSALDNNLRCRPQITEGVASSVSTCVCAPGFVWNAGFVPRGRCVATGNDGQQSSEWTTAGATDRVDEQEEEEDGGDGEVDPSSSTDRTDDDPVYVWWLFPPGLDNQSNEVTELPPAHRRSCHGFLYYGARVFSLTSLAYALMLFALFVPTVVVSVALLYYCHRRVVQSRQYRARRASLADSESSSTYYPESYAVPSSPSEKTKSVTFGFPSVDSNSKFASNNLFHKSADDKLDLVDNDQLDQMHRFA